MDNGVNPSVETIFVGTLAVVLVDLRFMFALHSGTTTVRYRTEIKCVCVPQRARL